jgi:UV DNA damage repair endonuclease
MVLQNFFYNTKTTTSFTIEVQHKPNENSIEVTLSASNTKLILNVVNYNYSFNIILYRYFK